MRRKRKHPPNEELEHIHPVRAFLLKIFGPAEGRGDPLAGTQHDPVVQQKIETEQQHERWARQEARGHPIAERRKSHADDEDAHPEVHEHSTPDRESS